ncbi:hypothetical protein ACLOJK_026490 [Asimina triloba]
MTGRLCIPYLVSAIVDLWMLGERLRENRQPWLPVFISNRLPLPTYARSRSNSSLSVPGSHRCHLFLPLFGRRYNSSLARYYPSRSLFFSLPVSIPLDPPPPSFPISYTLILRSASSLSLPVSLPLNPPPFSSRFPCLSFPLSLSLLLRPPSSLSRPVSPSPSSMLLAAIDIFMYASHEHGTGNKCPPFDQCSHPRQFLCHQHCYLLLHKLIPIIQFLKIILGWQMITNLSKCHEMVLGKPLIMLL